MSEYVKLLRFPQPDRHLRAAYRPRSARAARGQAAVEFALVAVVLMALIYGIMEISRLLLINAELENAVREGVHYAALHPDSATAAYLKTTVMGPHLTLIDVNSPNFVVNAPTFPNGVGPYYPVEVTASYSYTSLINFMPDVTRFTLRPLGPILLQATSTKLIEGQ